jgi:hypothetical protein
MAGTHNWPPGPVLLLSVAGLSHYADQPKHSARDDVRFSTRPVGVKRFQTIHHHSVEVARGLVLRFGIGT